jgi:hypothetical protein
MDRHLVTVTPSLWRDLEIAWDIDWRGQPSPDTLNGNSGTVFNAFPRWIGSPKAKLNRGAIPAWNAIRAMMEGRRGILRMPMNDPLAFDWRAAAAEYAVFGVPFSTGSLFSSGKGFAYTPTVLAVSDVAAGATMFEVDISPSGIAPVAGQIMSYDDWPFRVTSADPMGGDIYEIGVRMPIRFAIPADAEIEHRAFGRFELVDPRGGEARYGRRMSAEVTLSVQEVIVR